MIRRGAAVTVGAFTAADVAVTAGVEVAADVPVGAGIRPGAGGVAGTAAAVPVARVDVADDPATAGPVGAAGVVVVGEAVDKPPGAVALASEVAEGGAGMNAPDEMLPARRDSASAVAS